MKYKITKAVENTGRSIKLIYVVELGDTNQPVKKLACYLCVTSNFRVSDSVKVIDIRPMAPVLNTSPLEGI